MIEITQYILVTLFVESWTAKENNPSLWGVVAFLLNLHFSPGYEMFIVLYINNINLFIMFFYFQNVHSKMIKKHSTEPTVRVLILCHMVSVVSCWRAVICWIIMEVFVRESHCLYYCVTCSSKIFSAVFRVSQVQDVKISCFRSISTHVKVALKLWLNSTKFIIHIANQL